MTTTYTLHDETKKGPDLKINIDDTSFAYGLEMTVSDPQQQRRVLMLDYFDGRLIVRVWDDDKDEQCGALLFLNFAEE